MSSDLPSTADSIFNNIYLSQQIACPPHVSKSGPSGYNLFCQDISKGNTFLSCSFLYIMSYVKTINKWHSHYSSVMKQNVAMHYLLCFRKIILWFQRQIIANLTFYFAVDKAFKSRITWYIFDIEKYHHPSWINITWHKIIDGGWSFLLVLSSANSPFLVPFEFVN